MFLHPLFPGGYSEVLRTYMEERHITPTMQQGDLDTICQKLDFYGLNFYNGLYDNAEQLAAAAKSEAAGGNYQDRPEAHLEAVRDVLHMLVEDYHLDIPIYITENGVPQDSSDDVAAMLDDQERIDYVSEVLRWVHQAIGEGIDVRGVLPVVADGQL